MDAEGLHLSTLDPAPDGVRCRGCGAPFPVVDGVPVVCADPAAAVGFAAQPEAEARVAQYRASTRGALQGWLRRTVPAGALELGSGVGVRPDTVLLDAHLGMLRAAPNAARVCADVHDPPFAPESFPAVVLANVLDSVADPWTALRQAVGLLAPGGLLIVTCAYAFRDDITDPARAFTPAGLRGGLGAVTAGALTLEARLGLDWPLRVGPRLRHVYRCDALVFRRPVCGEPAPA